jgi:N-acetylmuramoyl-L-alanine amidase
MGKEAAVGAVDLTKHSDCDLLIACVRGEAEAEDVIGKIAVACVVRNRVKDKRWPDEYGKVVLQKQQFSCFLPKYFRPVILQHEFDNVFWRECKFAAWGVYHDYMRDVTNGANHYYSRIMKEPPKWARNEEPCFQWGLHIFYKL